MKRTLFFGISALLAGTLAAQSTISPALRFAYGANTGWINFRPEQPAGAGVTATEYTLAGFAYAANFGWLSLGGGSPADGVRYSNASGVDFGVNHDGAGNLSGFAYGANIGWVNFGWAGANDPNRPRVDMFTGEFAGFAYSANTGWINLGPGTLATTILCPDADGDAMADAWEIEHFGDTATASVGTDADGDGQSDAAEYAAGTGPIDNASWFRITRQSHSTDFTTVTVQFGTTGPTRLYRIEYTTDLAVRFGDCGLGAFAADPGVITSRTLVFPSSSARFYRAVAIKPLQ